MKCAKCGTPMETVTLGSTKVDQCPACSGIWFDFNELDQVLKMSNINVLRNKAQNNALDDQEKAPCPRCGGDGNMVQVVEPEHQIKIDTCSICCGKT